MPDKDVNIHVRAQEAEETKRKLESVADSTERMGQKTEVAGRAAAKGTGQAEEKVRSYAKAAAAATAVIAGLTAAIKSSSAAMEENAAIAERQQNALLRLQFLGGFFEERPELRKEVGALAEFGRRPYEEVANAWYNLRSKGAALSDTQRSGILREALEMGRTDPGLPLDTLVDMFALYAKKTGEGDANRIQNVLQETITQAGGSGADVAKYMPQFLPIGMAGGLSGAESAGLWSYATTLLGEASVATTGLKATFLGLEGKGTPEGQKLLKKLKIQPQMDFFAKLDMLGQAQQAGRFDLGSAEQLVGREGASILLDMIKDPGAVRATVDAVTAMDRGDIDLTSTRIEELMGADEVAMLEEDSRQLNIRIENLRGSDLNAMLWEKRIRQEEVKMRRLGYSEWNITAAKGVMRAMAGAGYRFDRENAPGWQRFVESGWYLDEPVLSSPGEEDAMAERAQRVISETMRPIQNIYDMSSHYRPVAGSREDRRIGERVSQD